jgi:hypothetical protein
LPLSAGVLWLASNSFLARRFLMTKAELIAALAPLPDDAEVFIEPAPAGRAWRVPEGELCGIELEIVSSDEPDNAAFAHIKPDASRPDGRTGSTEYEIAVAPSMQTRAAVLLVEAWQAEALEVPATYKRSEVGERCSAALRGAGIRLMNIMLAWATVRTREIGLRLGVARSAISFSPRR